MALALPNAAVVPAHNIPVPSGPSLASTPDVDMHGPMTEEQAMYVDARSLTLTQQNVEISHAGEVHAAAHAVRLAAELRFKSIRILHVLKYRAIALVPSCPGACTAGVFIFLREGFCPFSRANGNGLLRFSVVCIAHKQTFFR